MARVMSCSSGAARVFRRTAASVVAALVVVLLWVPVAARAAPTIQLSVAADPAESITTQISASGTDDSPSQSAQLQVTLKTAGGQPCGANYEADNGSTITQGGGGVQISNGPYAWTVNYTFSSAGSYLICAWIEDYSQTPTTVLATASLAVTVRPPHLSASISVPSTVQTGQAFQVATTAQAETSRDLYELVIANTGDGCPANAAAAESAPKSSSVFANGEDDSISVVGGPTTDTENQQFSVAGAYLYCAYWEYPNSSSPPEGTTSASLTVAAPPHCVVPKVVANMSLGEARSALAAAHCGAGTVTRVASRSVTRGNVVRYSSAAGTKLADRATIAIVISAGPPLPVSPTELGATAAYHVLQIRPARITYTGDGTGFLGGSNVRDQHSGIAWTAWKPTIARGSGFNQLDNCNPDCAAGRFTGYPVTLELWRPQVLGGTLVFTRMTIFYTRGSPEGEPRHYTFTDTYAHGAYGWGPPGPQGYCINTQGLKPAVGCQNINSVP